MNIQKQILVLSCVGALALAVSAQEAQACGGCVAPPNSFSAVDSHRMVVKLGLEESILWDQFIYSGSPEEFAWVLPVPTPDAVVELAGETFIDVIDEETSPIIVAPLCAEASGGGCGCGDPVTPETLAEGVVVHSHKMVGPYETVVIGGQDPNALFAWLSVNGYAFPASGLQTLEHYTAQQSSFVVLRLRPGLEVSAMQPVRVRFRGYLGQFPLRMVGLGALESIDLSLWVLAEERYAPTNFESIQVDPGHLVWDWEEESSNYEEAFQQSIDDAGGVAWVTEYAQVFDDSPLAARLFEEEPEDLALAKAGMHYPVLTRLRTTIPVVALVEDLNLGPSEDPQAVAREIVAEGSLGDCAVVAASAYRLKDPRVHLAFWMFLAVGLVVLRRRMRAGS